MDIQTLYIVSANDDTIRDRNSICEALILAILLMNNSGQLEL